MAEPAPHGSFQERGQETAAHNREAEGPFGSTCQHRHPVSPPEELLRARAGDVRRPHPRPSNPTRFDSLAIPAGDTLFGFFRRDAGADLPDRPVATGAGARPH